MGWIERVFGNMELEKENTLLRKSLSENKNKLDSLKAELDQTKKELAEAKKKECPPKPSEAQVLGFIPNSEVSQILGRLTKNVYLSDAVYSTTTTAEAERFVKETQVSLRKWVEDAHDCDNFSFALEGYWSEGLRSFAFGIAWSRNHAFNIMIDKDKQVWIVEPQANTFMTLEQAKKASSPDGVNYTPIRLVVM